MRRLLLISSFLIGCSTAAEHADQKAPPVAQAAGTVAAPAAAAAVTPEVARPDTAAPTIVRALYVNRWASQSRRRMAKLIATADSTEINALVVDMKDEFGLNYKPSNPAFAKNAGTAAVVNVGPLLDSLKAHKILAI